MRVDFVIYMITNLELPSSPQSIELPEITESPEGGKRTPKGNFELLLIEHSRSEGDLHFETIELERTPSEVIPPASHLHLDESGNSTHKSYSNDTGISFERVDLGDEHQEGSDSQAQTTLKHSGRSQNLKPSEALLETTTGPVAQNQQKLSSGVRTEALGSRNLRSQQNNRLLTTSNSIPITDILENPDTNINHPVHIHEAIPASGPVPTDRIAPPVGMPIDITATFSWDSSLNTSLPADTSLFGTTSAQLSHRSGQFVAANAQLPTAQSTTHTISLNDPAGIVGILRDTSSARPSDEQRIIVQLDPPELGRISIDFRFEGQALQAVSIAGENPEALKKLRLMHFELVQALSDRGLQGENLSFQQNTPGGQQNSFFRSFQTEQVSVGTIAETSTKSDTVASITTRQAEGFGPISRIDIKV